jgi:hypothetical protein
MANEAWLDSTGVRVTSEDGRTSYLYEVDSSGSRTRREVPEHKADGATDTFISSRDLDDLFWGRREKRA